MREAPLRFAVSAAFAAAVVLVGAGCSEPVDQAVQCLGQPLERPMLVLESDRSSSTALGFLDADGCFTEAADVSLGADPSLSYSRGRAFVCARDQGVILEVDAATNSIPNVFVTYTEGEEPPNPHDVAVDSSGRLWIARFKSPSVGVLMPDGSWGGSVDLSALGGADGIPDMEAITAAGDHIHVALERLNADYKAEGPGLLATISAPSFAVEGSLDLGAQNPFGRLIPAPWDPATVAAAAPGEIDAVTGGTTDGIVIISLESGEAELAISEADLGGSPIEVALAGPSEAYAILSGPVPDVNPTSVVAFNPETKKITRTLAGPADSFVHAGLAVNGPFVVVGDHTFGAPRIRFFDRSSGAEAFSITPRLLPPIGLLALEP
jgi:hypothetical protein